MPYIYYESRFLINSVHTCNILQKPIFKGQRFLLICQLFPILKDFRINTGKRHLPREGTRQVINSLTCIWKLKFKYMYVKLLSFRPNMTPWYNATTDICLDEYAKSSHKEHVRGYRCPATTWLLFFLVPDFLYDTRVNFPLLTVFIGYSIFQFCKKYFSILAL